MAGDGPGGMLRVALVGLGPIGCAIGRALAARPGVHLLGGADPGAAGRDLSELLGGGPSGHQVAASAGELYAATQATRGRADVVVLCTGSRLEAVAPQIEEAVRAGLNVVSTCEELAFPYLRHARLSQRLDTLARQHQVRVLATGVNPGLVMDRLPLALAQACVAVDRITVERVVDAAARREPLRRKVGAGLTREEFAAGRARGELGHAGLGESAAMVMRGLRRPFDEVRETIDPVIAEVETAGVPAGHVLGVDQTAVALAGGEEIVRLHLMMVVGAANPRDHIVIAGDPPIDVTIAGGLHGDRATVGTVVNALPHVLNGHAGVRTVIQLPLFGVFPIRVMTDD